MHNLDSPIRTMWGRLIAPFVAVFVALLLLGSGLSGFVLPESVPTAQAQPIAWAELPTEHFLILHAPDEASLLEAQAYAGFVDQVYNDMAARFQHDVERPLNLRLYPTFESYYEVNPVARNMPGIVAHADFRRRELAVILPRTEQQTPEGIRNNVRHELAHIFAADLSDNRLNTGFQEGIAQYIEVPTPEYDRKIALIQQASSEGRLIGWSDLQDRDRIYGEPDVGYPQSLSIVAFLIESYGFEKFRAFLVATAEVPGYRTALEQTYRTNPADLEAQWRAWLPSFIDGSYNDQPAATYNLSYPVQLMEQGRYAEAEQELLASIEWLRDTPQQEVLQEAEALLVRSRAGQQAEALAADARSALVMAEYDRAQQLVAEARAAYSAIGDIRQEQVLAVYAARATRGQHARQQLQTANALAETFRFPAARAAAADAASEFALLGDTQRMNNALALRASMDNIQRLAGLALVTLGMLGVIASLWGRWWAGEPEVW